MDARRGPAPLSGPFYAAGIAPSTPPGTVQTLVDGLSVALRRPVLLDDEQMAPIAYSSQGGQIDAVRSESILQRHPSPQVRERLERAGVAEATGPLRIEGDAELGMVARVCMPLRRDGRLLGYLWLLDPDRTVGDAEIDSLREAAEALGEQLDSAPSFPLRDEGPLFAALCASAADERDAALRALAERRLLAPGPLVVARIADGAREGAALELTASVVRRLSPRHALAATAPGGSALVLVPSDPALATIGVAGVAAWLHALGPAPLAVGQSDVVGGAAEIASANRRAAAALAAARAPSGTGHAAWAEMGADRLLAQLEPELLGDAPEPLLRLLREEPQLTATLAAFLDSGGDVKRTAAILSLQRSGLYYRLHRIEELTGLDLADGDDRLLAHLVVRLAALGQNQPA